MGTNYYVRDNYCEHCKRGEDLHIGKSSAGWCFALHVIPEMGLNTLDDWKAFLIGKPVFNEYSAPVTLDELMAFIAARKGYGNGEPFDYASNYAIRGPHGLARSKVDGAHCVGHGDGTWDYIAGEFS